ncbi:MAG: hypothetical protein U5R06_01220 [candidate division KSB1 bacterium]|nr:hypothetical protein [candidate division KSB1 bacterium]
MMMVIDPPGNESRRIMTEQMEKGFYRFCEPFDLQARVVHRISEVNVESGMCFVIHEDEERVALVGRLESENYRPGRDVGIISFNETPLKAKGQLTPIQADVFVTSRPEEELYDYRTDSLQLFNIASLRAIRIHLRN